MTGTQFAHYRIEAELGRGGMGIVYRAHDTKLDRTVALKVLPPHALSSEDDRARFQREARAAAKLQHAHIASIFEIGEAVPEDAPHGSEPRPFIAMEFVDGDSLADRIAGGPLKIAEATRIAAEIAEALEVAHEAGIVHRDVKSGNVMLTSKGQVKVLDFGLAKTAASTQLTRQGSTVGTVAYMSPEQARGDEVDARTDLWALGVVLYEMVSGRLPFSADYEQAALYGILNEEPDPLTAVRTGVPMPLEWIVGKLLAKKAGARYQSAREVVVDLENVEAAASRISSASMAAAESFGSPVGESGTAPPGHDLVVTRGWPLMLAVAAASLIAGYFIFSDFEEPEPRPLTRVEIPFPALQAFRFPALSPTGEWMAVFAFDTTGQTGIYLREMGTGRGRMVPDSAPSEERETYFSPDGTQLVFTRSFNSGVMVLTVPTGRPRRLTQTGRAVGWLDDRSILIVDDAPSGATYRYDLEAGTQEEIVPPSPDLGEGQQDIPKAILPGADLAFGHRLTRVSGTLTDSDLVLFDLGAGTVSVVETGAINPEYVAGGFLTYQQGLDDGPLVVRRVEEDTGAFLGPPTDVFDDGRIVDWGTYRVAPDGSLLFDPTQGPFSLQASLYRINLETGATVRVPWQAPSQVNPGLPSYSPDGSSMLVELERDGSDTMWLYDVATGSLRQLTFGADEKYGTWSPDGSTIWFECGDSICSRGIKEGASIDTVVASAWSPHVSRSGRYLAYTTMSDNIFLRDMSTGMDIPIDTAGERTMLPAVSPDERYVAYVSSVDDGALTVRPIVGSGDYRLPGQGGGSWIPRWSPDGRFIYYGTVGGVRRVRVSTEGGFRFEGSSEIVVAGTFPLFDVSPDGTEIAISGRSVRWALGEAVEAERTVYNMVWWQNWADHLERTLPR